MAGNFNITEAFNDTDDAGFYEGVVTAFIGEFVATSTATMTTSGFGTAYGAVTMTTAGSSLSVGYATRHAALTMTVSSGMTVTAKAIAGKYQLVIPLNEFWFYRGFLTENLHADATSTFSVVPLVTAFGQVTMSGKASSLTLTTSSRHADAVLDGDSTMSVSAHVFAETAVTMASTANAVFVGYQGLLGEAMLAGDASVTGSAMMVSFKTVSMAGTSGITVDGSAVKLARATLKGKSVSTVDAFATTYSYHWLSGEAMMDAKPARTPMHGKTTMSVIAWPPTVHLGDDTASVTEKDYTASQHDWQVQWSNRVRKSLTNA